MVPSTSASDMTASITPLLAIKFDVMTAASIA